MRRKKDFSKSAYRCRNEIYHRRSIFK